MQILILFILTLCTYVVCAITHTLTQLHTHTLTVNHSRVLLTICQITYLSIIRIHIHLISANIWVLTYPFCSHPSRRRRASSSFKHNTSFVARLPTIRRHKSQTIQTPGGGDGGGVSKPPGSSRASTRYTRTIRDINASVENLGKLVGNRAAPSDFRLCFPFPFHCEFLFAHSTHAHTHTDSFWRWQSAFRDYKAIFFF